MSKRMTTRWYIGSWIVYILALVAFFMVGRTGQGTTSAPPGVVLAYVVMVVTGIVMLVAWIGALVKLGQQQAWGWFAAVLVLHLVGLGIVGMVAYAITGPEDDVFVAIRPSTPV
jgi:hypothetical protein